MKTKFTEEVLELLKDLGPCNASLLKNIADAVNSLPRTGETVDTSDNAIKVYGQHISFIRDWERGETLILTNGETRRLDMYTAFQNGQLF